MKLVNVTAVPTHAQSPLQTGDLKLAVDVIERISEKSLEIIYQQYPDPKKRAEKVQNITQVGLAIFYYSLVLPIEFHSGCILERNIFLDAFVIF